MKQALWVLMVLMGASWAFAQCDNPYFPVRSGWEWTYRNSDGTRYTSSILNTSSNSFTLRHNFDGKTQDIRYLCDNGSIIAADFSVPGEATFKMETVSRNGSAFPNRITTGTSWRYTYEVRGTMNQGGNDSLVVQGTVEVVSRALAVEAVATPAGNFQAIKVESTTNMRLTGNLNGINIPVPMRPFTSTSWLVQNIGMVKSVSGNITTELVGLNR